MGFSCRKYDTKKAAQALGITEDVLLEALNANVYGGYARIWSVEDKGNYSTARMSVSKKNKESETYVTEFSDGFVRLVGQAHKAMQGVSIDEKGVSVRIVSCDVTNLYTSPDGKVSYTPHYSVFALDLLDGNNSGNINVNSAKDSGKDEFMTAPDNIDEVLPFA